MEQNIYSLDIIPAIPYPILPIPHVARPLMTSVCVYYA